MGNLLDLAVTFVDCKENLNAATEAMTESEAALKASLAEEMGRPIKYGDYIRIGDYVFTMESYGTIRCNLMLNLEDAKS